MKSAALFCSQSKCNRLRSPGSAPKVHVTGSALIGLSSSRRSRHCKRRHLSLHQHTHPRGVTGGAPMHANPREAEPQKGFLASGDSSGGARARTCLGCVLWGEGGGGLLYVATLRAFTYRRVVSHAVSVRFLCARISAFDFWRTICPQINFAHKFREIWADKNEITQQNLGACGAQFCGQG